MERWPLREAGGAGYAELPIVSPVDTIYELLECETAGGCECDR